MAQALEVDAGTTVGELVEALLGQHPTRTTTRVPVAVDGEVVARTVTADADVPPSSLDRLAAMVDSVKLVARDRPQPRGDCAVRCDSTVTTYT